MVVFEKRNLLVLATILSSVSWSPAGETSQEPVPSAAEKPATTNPYTSESDIRRGRMQVRAYCSVCHGREGQGGRGPSLISGSFRRGSTDRAILDNIKNGITGTDMTAFPVDDDFIWPIVSYMRAAAAPEPTPPGDPKKGERILVKHNCTTCHWLGTEGGRRGPDLSALAAPAGYVRTSILDPDANFREQPAYQHHPYQRVQVVTDRGKTLEGRWMNENGYFVQFIDANEDLQTIARDEIDQMSKPPQSLMPSFRELLNERELQDLIAYVFSLRPNFDKGDPE